MTVGGPIASVLRHATRGTALALVIAAATVTSCSSGGGAVDRLPPSVATTTGVAAASPSPSASGTSSGDPIVDAYRFYWRAFINGAATGSMRPEDQLDLYATGQARTYALNVVSELKKNGLYRSIQEGFRFNERVVSSSSTEAVVRDCQPWDKYPVYRVGTRQFVLTGSPREGVTATLLYVDGRWKVVKIVLIPGKC